MPEHKKAAPALHYLTEEQLGDRIGWTRRRLQELRRVGGGPQFIRNGLKVLYVTASVLEWETTLARENPPPNDG